MFDEEPEETDHDVPDVSKTSGTSDAGRRDFIKKLPYVALVIQTFLMSEGALAKKGDNTNSKGKGGGVSPNPGKGKGKTPPPPPPG